MWTLIRTDFKARYHGAASGFVWALLKPLAMFLVLFAVFSFLFRDRTYLYNLLIGLLIWDVFSAGTRVGLESLYDKGYLLTSAAFPRWVVVLTSLANAFMTLLVFCVAILIVISLKQGLPTAAGAALFVFYMITLFFIVFGFALGTSVLFLKYRDLNQIWDVILQAGFFVAPIVYPLDILPERLHFYLFVWPVTPVIQFSRQVLVQHTTPTLKAHALLIGVTLITFISGYLLFRRYSSQAVERL